MGRVMGVSSGKNGMVRIIVRLKPQTDDLVYSLPDHEINEIDIQSMCICC